MSLGGQSILYKNSNGYLSERKKIALVHDWFISIGGAEKVTREIYEILGKPSIYTIISNKNTLKKLGIDESYVNAIFKNSRIVNRFYKFLFPLYPILIEQINLMDYDIIISSSHFVAKGVLRRSDQIHICYCHTPPRYLWDLYFPYIKNFSSLKRIFFIVISHYLRMWDYYSSQRVDYFIANSKYVANRIKKFYGKDSIVIYPPVETNKFPLVRKKEDFYVIVTRLVPYKNVELIVKAFNKMQDKKLIIIGTGEEFKRLKKLASKNIEFLGYVNEEELKYYLSHASAFIYASEEDFGISPVEAQACGTPVIAYGKGGVLETVIEDKTGLFFKELSPESLISTINHFEKIKDKFEPTVIRRNAERFSVEIFRKRFLEFLSYVTE